MNVFEQFLTLPMAILCLVIMVLVWLQRKLVKLFLKKVEESTFWRELALPAGPIGTGAIIGILASKYPFPEMMGTSWDARMFCGIVCGLCSGMVYRMLKQFLAAKAGQAAPTDQDPVLPE